MKGMIFSHYRKMCLVTVTVASLIWTVSPGVRADEILTYLYNYSPPMQYAPDAMPEGRPDITLELMNIATKNAGIAYERKYYTPSRVHEMAIQGKADLIAIVAEQAAVYQETMICREKSMVTLSASLYQNIDREAPFTDIRSELTGKTILAPAENRALLESLLPPGNIIQEVVKPELLVPMFAGQRAFYMIDLVSRSEVGLQQEPPSFEYVAYPLASVEVVFCINKDFPNAATVLEVLSQRLSENNS